VNSQRTEKHLSRSPAVSVIIPVRNCADTIRESLQSVFDQDFSDYEIIVVDDGSTDKTMDILSSFADRIKILRQQGRGAASARNLAINHSRGRYLAFLDADDSWFPSKLFLQYDYLEKHPEIGLVYSDLSTFNKAGECSSSYDSHHRKVYQGRVFAELLLKNFIGTITVVARRECFDKVGLFPEEFTHSSDWHQWLRIARYYPIGYINIPLAHYRWSESSLTSRMEVPYPSRLRVLKDMRRIFPDYFRKHPSLFRRAISGGAFRYGYALFKNKDKRAAAVQFKYSLKNNPIQWKSYLFLLGLSIPPSVMRGLVMIKRKMKLRFMPAE